MRTSFTPPYRFKRTRLAPTPSGYLHLGNILSFVQTVALARKTGAAILLRIDDMDRDRAQMAFIRDIFDTLAFLELPWDEGPRDAESFITGYSQTTRLHLYGSYLERLRKEGLVYACTCSRAEILKRSREGTYTGNCRGNTGLDEAGSAWRLQTDGQAAMQVRTLEGVIRENVLPPSVMDFVVRRKDGLPAYQLTSLVDDLHYEVDLVVRGADLWPSTLAQHFLARLLKESCFGDISFHHHSLLLDAGGQKLSKSAGATSVYGLRKEGCSAARIYQKIAAMAGVKEPVGDWRSLADALEEKSSAGAAQPGAPVERNDRAARVD